ncbi:MAG: DUF1214 domain-containing protein [Deltaproteobacteria bacterium]|nr:DUF1214 domain-containing protein [Deltaproteobacteria bacterium]
MTSEAEKRILDGTSWNEFCDSIKMAGSLILADGAPDDPLTRAEGFRFLSRVTRTALEAFVEHADPLAPTLHRPVHETVKMGADNPDNYYQFSRISGEHEYRIRGTRGTIHYLGFGTYVGMYGTGGRSEPTGYVEGKDLEVGEDGSLEVVLSCEKKPGNWLPMEPDTSSLIVRQMFLDRQSETIADLTIERIGAARGPTPLTPEGLDEALGTAGRLVGGVAMIFSTWADGFRAHVNTLPEFDQSTSLAAHGDPNICYYHSYWKLAPDEALVVEATPPECDYWNFQLNNHWMESLDYVHHRICINKHDAVYGKGGSVRIVVTHEDPGVPNWLDTAGHAFGTMCFRWVRAKSHPQPQTRVVKLSELPPWP